MQGAGDGFAESSILKELNHATIKYGCNSAGVVNLLNANPRQRLRHKLGLNAEILLGF
jgi:hypothetical protein